MFSFYERWIPVSSWKLSQKLSSCMFVVRIIYPVISTTLVDSIWERYLDQIFCPSLPGWDVNIRVNFEISYANVIHFHPHRNYHMVPHQLISWFSNWIIMCKIIKKYEGLQEKFKWKCCVCFQYFWLWNIRVERNSIVFPIFENF